MAMAIDAWGLFFPHRGRQLQLQAGCAVLYLMVAGIAPCGSVDGHVLGCDGRVSVSRILCQIEVQEELLRRTSAAGGTTGHSHRLSERLRLRGGRWGGGGGGYKREYDQVSDENIPTFGIMNPSDEHPQIPFARKEGKIIEFEFPEGMTEDDDAEQLGEDRAARAERRRRARERELAGVNPVLEERDEASPPPNGPEDEEDERPLKDQFLATLSDDEREVTKEFIEYQQKKDPHWDWQQMTWEEMERFYNATDEATRTDDFPLLPRDKAEALERDFKKETDKYPYLPDLLTSSPIPRLVTWWHSKMAQYGIMWDVRARGRSVTIRKIHAGSFSTQGPVPYTLWTTEGHWRYKCHSERMWKQIGGGVLQLPYDRGVYQSVPLAVEGLEIKAGCTQAFYLHTAADEDGVALRTWPMEAVDDGENCAEGKAAYDPERETWSVDGTMYSLDYAKPGGVVDRNADLLVLRAVVSPEPTPFANISEHEIPVAWCGMIDYEVNNVSASKHVAARPFK